MMAGGMGGDSLGHWHLVYDGNEGGHQKMSDKPAYRVPTMSEIAAIPWNGLKVASTFSGAGGSCLGYRMAGYRVVWANEFVPIVQKSYRANMADGCHLDERDIRVVTAADILAQTGLAKGELDLFDGSPPCQAFSTAGKRAKGWGTERHYEHGASQKNEELFFEYIRLLDGLQPRVFVAENVSGLLKGVAKGFFLEILAGLKGCGYRVSCRLLDAKWLGVPQSRQRAIFVGVREDLGIDPVHPKPLPYLYSVRDALPWLIAAESSPTGFGAGSIHVDKVAPAVSASGQAPWGGARVIQDESGQQSRGEVTDQPAPTVRSGRAGTMFVASSDGRGAGNEHSYEVVIGNDAFNPKWGSPEIGPSPTIMAGGAHGGSGEIRNVATAERRKFTIAEVKRICAFPDDFVLIGSYAQQWSCLGNSVPPVMMRHIAETIRDKVLTDG